MAAKSAGEAGLVAGDLSPSHDAALFFGGATPDTRVLVGLECELETTLADGAFTAHFFGPCDLGERMAGGSDREEQVGVGVTTD